MVSRNCQPVKLARGDIRLEILERVANVYSFCVDGI